MRRVLFILSLFMLVCGYIEARTIIVEIGNIRGNHGNILVMAQSGKDTMTRTRIGKWICWKEKGLRKDMR